MAGFPLAPPRRAAAATARVRTDVRYLTVSAAILSVGVGYIHLAYTQSHWRDWWAYGVFFLATAIFQQLFGIAILLRPGARLALLGIAGNIAIVGMYIYSRTIGVPLGPHARVKEDVGAIDLATTGAEIVLAAMLLILVGARARRWTINLLLVAGLGLWVMRLTQGAG